MSQGFDPTKPADGSPLSSSEIRILLNAINSAHSGTSEPANAINGMSWLDTNGNKIFKIFNNGSWRVVFSFDATGDVVFDGGSFT